MTDANKIKLVQAFAGAVVLALLLQVLGLFDQINLLGLSGAELGWQSKTWLTFFPLLLFFAFGADFKLIPEMIISYIVGIVWCLINGVLTTLITGGNTESPLMIVAIIVLVFCILTVHQNFFEGKIFSNIACIFMGLGTSFYITKMGADVQPAYFGQLTIIWIYGLFLAVALVLSGMFVCKAIFGEERTMAALMPQPQEEK